ncbi:MAG: DUF1993 domain-containing protein [Hyphomonadaceae bacterium]|nr:DUF1993 domain-containing protein [Hyphomonadaceae bacterium]
MTEFMHAASAGTFTRMLNSLSAVLDKAEAHAKAKNFDVDILLNSRLAPDMFSLIGQIQLATVFAKNAICRLAGQEPPNYEDNEKTLPELRARIARTLDIVGSIGFDALSAADTRQITFRVGPTATLTTSGVEYLLHFAVPNFYFHVTTAYAILRHNGVQLGKRDFMAIPQP